MKPDAFGTSAGCCALPSFAAAATATACPFALYVRNDNHRAKLVKLIAQCGPLDLDDPQPAITVMMPDED